MRAQKIGRASEVLRARAHPIGVRQANLRDLRSARKIFFAINTAVNSSFWNIFVKVFPKLLNMNIF